VRGSDDECTAAFRAAFVALENRIKAFASLPGTLDQSGQISTGGTSSQPLP
jgi:hypothetical protein